MKESRNFTPGRKKDEASNKASMYIEFEPKICKEKHRQSCSSHLIQLVTGNDCPTLQSPLGLVDTTRLGSNSVI
jgi:hypothetical protein